MQFTVLQSVLNQHLSLISSVIPSSPSHPILGNVRIDVANNLATLTGFDLRTAIQVKFSVEVVEEGSFTLPLGFLKNLISRIEEGQVKLTLLDAESGQFQIKTATGDFKIQGLPSNQFPNLPEITAEENITIPVDVFQKGLAGTIFAASKEETKMILTGVLITKTDSQLEFAATDSHRLAIVTLEVDSTIPDFRVIVPRFSLGEVSKLVTASKVDKISIEVSNNTYILFRMGNYTLISRLLEGTYPAYRQLIPTSFKITGILNKKQLLDKISIISIIAESKNHLIEFHLDNNELGLQASNEQGTAKEKLEVQELTENLSLAFNFKYLIDGLKTLTSENLTINANNERLPVIFTPVNTSNISAIYLVMPIQISK